MTDYKELAKKLLNELGRSKESVDDKTSLTNRMKTHAREVIKMSFKDWCADKKGRVYVSDTDYSRSRTFLLLVEGGLSENEIREAYPYRFSTIPTELNKAERRINDGLKFLNDKGDFEKNDLRGLKWDVFFLFYPEGHNAEALLGKATLSIDMDHNVHFENTGEYGAADYDGDYESHIHSDHGLIIFNLRRSKNDERHLHIKIMAKQKDREAMTGMFTTYEGNRVESGTILFLKKVKKQIDAGIYNFVNNPQIFIDGTVIDPRVTDFFRFRSNNYLRVFTNVDSLNKIEAKSQQYQMLDHRNTWFLEHGKPKVFISSPKLAAVSENAGVLNDILEDLRESQELNKLNILADDITKEKDDDGNYLPTLNLMELRSVRVFVIIIEEINKASFSLVQLGWALRHSKRVILAYKVGSVSKRILDIKTKKDENILRPIPFKNALSLNTWKTEIRDNLIKEIQLACKDYLDITIE